MTKMIDGVTMYEKGYRYRIDFKSGTPSLYVKTIEDVAHLMRTDYKNEKYRVRKLRADGSFEPVPGGSK